MKNKMAQNKKTSTASLARILVPADFSSNAARALRYAVPLARQVGGRLKRFILGSAAGRVVRHAPCPVLVVY